MLNRRHIRIKVMQTLYACRGNSNNDIKDDVKFLTESLNSMYDLHLLILALFIELQNKAKIQAERSQKKFLATDLDKNPNKKFIENQVLKLIADNNMLKNLLQKRKLNFWDLDFEYVDIIYNAILESDIYKKYMATKDSSFAADKTFIIDIFSGVIAPHEKLYDYFEDKKLTWIDDLPVVNTNLVKMLKKVKTNAPETYLLPELYKDEDDLSFATKLLTLSMNNEERLNQEINSKTTNWDSERLASIDGVLLKMAITELQNFPLIPVKVTINEYLEIAKEYSTPKSSLFINGILDKIIKEYKLTNQYPKSGRGLVQ